MQFFFSRGDAEPAEKGKKLCFLAKLAKAAKKGKKIQVFGFPRSQRLCERQTVLVSGSVVHLISRRAAEPAEKGKKLCFLAKAAKKGKKIRIYLAKLAKGAKKGKKIQVFGFPRSLRLCEKQQFFGFLSELSELCERKTVLVFCEPCASARNNDFLVFLANLASLARENTGVRFFARLARNSHRRIATCYGTMKTLGDNAS